MSTKVRTRFAPSPTGYLHVGGARTALFNYLFARSQGGTFIIRVEDTDIERNKAESEKMILESLQWLGLHADEGPAEGGSYGPYRQSERLDVYRKYVDRLLEKKLAYPCFCTSAELESKQEKSKKMGLPHVYDGKCRGLSDKEIADRKAAGDEFAIRFKVDPGEVSVEDLVQGRVKFDSRLIGDFIIVKSNGFPSYNFAVVCDDHEMEITHVIRGVGHLSNTPRQILIHRALDLPLPAYAHISEIVGADRKKMSKRRGATSILFFRDLGYLSDAFTNYMALLGWYPDDGVEYMSRAELEAKFELERCSKSPSMFDFFKPLKEGEDDFDPAALSRTELQKYINNKSKLNWLNNRYIREVDFETVWKLALPYIQQDRQLVNILKTDEEQLRRAFDSVRVYLDTLADAVPYLTELFKTDLKVDGDEAAALLKEENTRTVARNFMRVLTAEKPGTPEQFSEAMKEAGKLSEAKGKHLFMPIRVASTGSMQGLELPMLFSILGYETVIQRIRAITGVEAEESAI